MKTHVIWFCISIAAFSIGIQFAKKEVQVVDRPIDVVRTNEVFVERPLAPSDGAGSQGEKPPDQSQPLHVGGGTQSEKIEEQKARSSIVDKRHSPAEKAKLHQRYDMFLGQFGLSRAQIDRFVELKLAIFEAQDDLQAAVARNAVQGGAPQVEAIRKELTTSMWDEIHQLLGDDGFKAYRDFEQISAVRPMVTSLFEGAGVATSDQQVDQVARLIIKNTQLYRANPTDISTRSQIDWSTVARDAERILNPDQIAAIRLKASQSPTH